MGIILRILLLLLACYLVVMGLFWWIMMSGGKDTRYDIYASGVTFNGGAAVSPTGDLYFSSPVSGKGDIYCLEADDCTTRLVVGGDECEISPVLSRDGQLLAYCREFRMHSDVIVLDLSTGLSHTYETPRGVYDSPAEFSADGKHLLVHRGVHSGGLGMGSETHLLDLASGRYTPLPVYSCFGPDDTLWGSGDHADGTQWIAVYDLEGELLRWVTRGDYMYTVDHERRDLVVKRGTKWVFLNGETEQEIPMETRWNSAVRFDSHLIWGHDRGAGLVAWNASTGELTDNILPKHATLEVDEILVNGEAMILMAEIYPYHLFYVFDPDSDELIELVSTKDAVSLREGEN